MGFPGGSEGKVSGCNVGDPGSGRSPGEGKWQPTAVLLPGKFLGRRSLIGYSPWGCKVSDTTERLCFHFHSAYKLKSRVTIYSLDILLSQFGTSPFSMIGSNCSFLTCTQISQEEGKVVWYSHLLKNFPQFVMIHTVKGFTAVNEAEVDVFFGILLLFLQSSGP